MSLGYGYCHMMGHRYSSATYIITHAYYHALQPGWTAYLLLSLHIRQIVHKLQHNIPLDYITMYNNHKLSQD